MPELICTNCRKRTQAKGYCQHCGQIDTTLKTKTKTKLNKLKGVRAPREGGGNKSQD